MAIYGLETEVTTHIKGMQFGDSQSDTGGGNYQGLDLRGKEIRIWGIQEHSNLAIIDTDALIMPTGNDYDTWKNASVSGIMALDAQTWGTPQYFRVYIRYTALKSKSYHPEDSDFCITDKEREELEYIEDELLPQETTNLREWQKNIEIGFIKIAEYGSSLEHLKDAIVEINANSVQNGFASPSGLRLVLVQDLMTQIQEWVSYWIDWDYYDSDYKDEIRRYLKGTLLTADIINDTAKYVRELREVKEVIPTDSYNYAVLPTFSPASLKSIEENATEMMQVYKEVLEKYPADRFGITDDIQATSFSIPRSNISMQKLSANKFSLPRSLANLRNSF